MARSPQAPTQATVVFRARGLSKIYVMGEFKVHTLREIDTSGEPAYARYREISVRATVPKPEFNFLGHAPHLTRGSRLSEDHLRTLQLSL